MKTISILLAMVNTLLAGLLLAHILSTNELTPPGSIWSLTKSVAALSVILIGVITWLASVNAVSSSPLLISGVYLVVLGTVTIVWTYHVAVLSGDIEYYMVIYGGSLMIQGIASLLGFGSDSRTMTIS